MSVGLGDEKRIGKPPTHPVEEFITAVSQMLRGLAYIGDSTAAKGPGNPRPPPMDSPLTKCSERSDPTPLVRHVLGAGTIERDIRLGAETLELITKTLGLGVESK